jgi:deoxyribodipyrimidine photo-lyase
MQNMTLRREFASRTELTHYLRQVFPHAGGDPSPIRGGRTAALERLDQIDPERYGATRNFLDGAVTRLSMYIRHGILSLPEVRRAALARVAHAQRARKLIQELAWRDYWQRIWHEIGDGIWENLEPYKTGWRTEDYAPILPEDVAEARTGLACIDAFARALIQTGYLHNHARMWLAAYVVHWRRVRWQAGARWFLRHLLDGDPASNNLSWQWVASTFSHRPYFYNRANLERYTAGRFCANCSQRSSCPFKGT